MSRDCPGWFGTFFLDAFLPCSCVTRDLLLLLFLLLLILYFFLLVPKAQQPWNLKNLPLALHLFLFLILYLFLLSPKAQQPLTGGWC